MEGVDSLLSAVSWILQFNGEVGYKSDSLIKRKLFNGSFQMFDHHRETEVLKLELTCFTIKFNPIVSFIKFSEHLFNYNLC